MAAYLAPPPADLTAKPTQTKTDAQLRKIIMEGRSGTAMTGHAASLNEAQIEDLLAYIRSLQPRVLCRANPFLKTVPNHHASGWHGILRLWRDAAGRRLSLGLCRQRRRGVVPTHGTDGG